MQDVDLQHSCLLFFFTLAWLSVVKNFDVLKFLLKGVQLLTLLDCSFIFKIKKLYQLWSMVESLMKTLNHRSTHSEDISPELCEGAISRHVQFCLLGCFTLFCPLPY